MPSFTMIPAKICFIALLIPHVSSRPFLQALTGGLVNTFEAIEWHSPKETPLRNTYFNSMGLHEIPLLTCQPTKVTKYRLPDVPECQSEVEDSFTKFAQRVNVTFWQSDNKEKPQKAYFCEGKRFRIKTGKVWWNTKETFEFAYIPIIDSVCREMLKTKKSPDGHQMDRNKEVYSWDPAQDAEPYWFASRTQTWDSYYLIPYTIGVEPDTGIISTTLGLKESCVVKDNHCEGKDGGMLIWDYKPEDHCSLVATQRLNCLYHSSILLCESANMRLTTISKATFCDHTLAYSDQTMLFSLDGEYELDFKTTPTRVVDRSLHRPRRSTSLSSQGYLNAQLEYNSYVNLHNFRLLEIEMCLINQREIREIRTIAQKENPNILIEGRFGRGYKGIYRNNLLYVWRCTEVKEYMFQVVDKLCTLEFPLKYRVNGQTYSGYLDSSMEIVSEPTADSTCSTMEFYFTYGKNSMNLMDGNKAVFEQFPKLPETGSLNSPIKYKKPNHNVTGDLTDTFFQNYEMQRTAYQQLHKQIEHSKILNQTRAEIKETRGKMDNLFEMIMSKVHEFLEESISWIWVVLVIVFIALGIIILTILYQLICKIHGCCTCSSKPVELERMSCCCSLLSLCTSKPKQKTQPEAEEKDEYAMAALQIASMNEDLRSRLEEQQPTAPPLFYE